MQVDGSIKLCWLEQENLQAHRASHAELLLASQKNLPPLGFGDMVQTSL